MPAMGPEEVLKLIAHGATTRIEKPARSPRFNVGDSVVTRNLHPFTHTRLPRYARNRRGTIAAVHGMFALPDTNATGAGPNHQYVYSVRFTAGEIWGSQASPNQSLYLDLWDDYLDLAK